MLSMTDSHYTVHSVPLDRYVSAICVMEELKSVKSCRVELTVYCKREGDKVADRIAWRYAKHILLMRPPLRKTPQTVRSDFMSRLIWHKCSSLVFSLMQFIPNTAEDVNRRKSSWSIRCIGLKLFVCSNN